MFDKLDLENFLSTSGFSKSESLIRLGRIQSLIPSNSNHVVFVPIGIDCRYNDGCLETANYLFFDLFTFLTSELESKDMLEDIAEDLMIAITNDWVAVYCNPLIYDVVLPFIYHWRNINVFCLKKFNSDTDELEMYKVNSFIKMMEGRDKVMIPYKTRKDFSGIKLDKFLVEKWPIIQSYALDGVGKGTFFTIEHEVINIYNKITDFFGDLDGQKLYKCLLESVKLTVKHWDEVNKMFSCESFDELTHKKASEPLTSYYKHGSISHQPTQQVVRPFVKFGTFTQPDSEYLPEQKLRNSNQGSFPLHMLLQSVAPQSQIVCTRTYFFPPNIYATVEEKENFRRLTLLYSLCVEACQIAIKRFCESNQDKNLKPRDDAANHILPFLGTLATSKLDIQPTVQVSLESAVENKNSIQWCQVEHVSKESTIKRITVSVHNIPSYTNTVLGSVEFSDTFVDSYINLDETFCETSSEYLVLTSCIDAYKEFSCSGLKDQKLERRQFIQTTSNFSRGDILKQPVVNDKKNDIIINNLLFCSTSQLIHSTSEVSIEFLFEKMQGDSDDSQLLSFSLKVKDYQPISVDLLKDVDRIELTSPTLTDSNVLFEMPLMQVVLKSTSTLCCHPLLFSDSAFVNLSGSSCFAIAIPNENWSFFQKEIVPSFIKRNLKIQTSEENPFFKNDTENCIDALKEAVANFATMHNKKLSYKSSQCKFDFHKDKSRFSWFRKNIEDFECHLSVSRRFEGQIVTKQQKDILLKMTTELKSFNESKVPVYIVIGNPTSHTGQLVKSLVECSREKKRWVVIQCTSKNQTDELDYLKLLKSINLAVSKRKSIRPGAAANKKLQIIINCNGYFDMYQLISVVLSDENTKISNVIYCTDDIIANQYSAAGWCNSVVYTGVSNSQKDVNFKQIQHYNRLSITNASFVFAEKGVKIQSKDFNVLLNDEFERNEFVRMRMMSLPFMYLSKKILPSHNKLIKIDRLSVDFYQPLLKGVFETRLRAIKKLVSNSLVAVTGIVSFIGNKLDHEVTYATKTKCLTYVIKDQNGLIPQPPKNLNVENNKPVSYHLTFYGTSICKQTVMDWIQKCGRQKPTLKQHKTKDDLSQKEYTFIQNMHKTEELPEGYYYNGNHYVNFFNDIKSQYHPKIDRFIEEYLKEQNLKVDAYNLKLKKTEVPDMFQPMKTT